MADKKPYITHRHHIIPRHAGGGDSDGNYITLTVEEHAEAHRVLYEKHGRWQDKVAWLSLSRQMTQDDARAEARRKAVGDFHRGRKRSDETKKRMSEAAKKRSKEPYIGRKMTDETKRKMSEAAMGRQNALGSKREKVKCPKCGEVGPVNVWARWHGDNCGKVWKPSSETLAAISKAKTGVPWSDARLDAHNERHGTIHHHSTAYRTIDEAAAGAGLSKNTVQAYLGSKSHPEWRRVKP